MNSMKAALEKAKLSPIDIAWYERQTGKRYAPAPPCVLRHLAKKAGFMSTVEWLADEHAKRVRRAEK